MQSGGDDSPDLMEMRLNTLKQNAINAGYNETDIEVKWVTDAEYESAKAEDPGHFVVYEKKTQLLAEIDNAKTITDLKALMKKLV